MKKGMHVEGQQSATDILRYDLVKLRGEVAQHYSKTHKSDTEKYAFSKLVKVFEISLEPYMDKEIIKQIMEHYKELDNEISQLKNDTKLGKDTRNHNIILKEFEYAEPIWHMTLRIFHHCPLIEYEAEGILNPQDPDIRDKVRDVKKKTNVGLINEDNINDELPDQL